MKQGEHLFQFHAKKIAAAAAAERDYHVARQEHWRQQREMMIERAKSLTAIVRVSEQQMSGGGKLVQVVADIIELQDLNWKLQTACQKFEEHRKAADEYNLKAEVYGTQDRVYDLDPADVQYFRLAGGARSE